MLGSAWLPSKRQASENDTLIVGELMQKYDFVYRKQRRWASIKAVDCIKDKTPRENIILMLHSKFLITEKIEFTKEYNQRKATKFIW